MVATRQNVTTSTTKCLDLVRSGCVLTSVYLSAECTHCNRAGAKLPRPLVGRSRGIGVRVGNQLAHRATSSSRLGSRMTPPARPGG